MASTLNDWSVLPGDNGFGGRVASAVWSYITSTLQTTQTSSSLTPTRLLAMRNFGAQVLGNQNFWKSLFVSGVAANSIIGDQATAAGSAATGTGSISATTLTWTNTTGAIVAGMTMSGAGVAADTIVLPFGTNGTTGTGGTGTYAVSVSQTVASEAMTGGPTILDSTNVAACAKAVTDTNIENAAANVFGCMVPNQT